MRIVMVINIVKALEIHLVLGVDLIVAMNSHLVII